MRPDWDEAVVLAELDPWFKLTSESSVEKWRVRKKQILAAASALRFFLDEMTANTGLATFLADPATYPLVSGTRPDRYRGFMCQTWAHAGPRGTIGLLHPDTHLEGVREEKTACCCLSPTTDARKLCQWR